MSGDVRPVRRTRAIGLGLLGVVAACGQVDFTAREVGPGSVDARLAPPVPRVHFTFDTGAFLTGGEVAATCETCPSATPGRPGRGGAALFTGAHDLTVADQPTLRWPALTVAFWVRIDALPVDVTVLASKQLRSASTSLNTWEVYLHSEGELNLGVITDTGWVTLALWPDLGLVGGWHHVAHSYDGTRLRFYVDGVVRGASEAGALDYDDSPFGFGHDVDSGAAFAYLEGALDDVMLFDRVLTEAEVAALATP